MDEFEYTLIPGQFCIGDVTHPRNEDGLTEGQVEEIRATYNSTTLDNGDQPEGLLRAFPAAFAEPEPAAERWERTGEFRAPLAGQCFEGRSEGVERAAPDGKPTTCHNAGLGERWILRKIDE